VKLEGTFRTMDEEWRMTAHDLIINQCKSIALSFGGTIDVDVIKGYPFLKNDKSLTNKVKTGMKDFLGEEFVVDLPIRMTAEDFSYYSQVMPACFYRLGIRNELKNITSPVHTPTFDIDDDALVTGMSMMAYLAMTL
jgi:metal-dependent amidase/aminoacylase/carboxypeptidase family protein